MLTNVNQVPCLCRYQWLRSIIESHRVSNVQTRMHLQYVTVCSLDLLIHCVSCSYEVLWSTMVQLWIEFVRTTSCVCRLVCGSLSIVQCIGLRSFRLAQERFLLLAILRSTRVPCTSRGVRHGVDTALDRSTRPASDTSSA